MVYNERKSRRHKGICDRFVGQFLTYCKFCLSNPKQGIYSLSNRKHYSPRPWQPSLYLCAIY